jgi:hypothetical protein
VRLSPTLWNFIGRLIVAQMHSLTYPDPLLHQICYAAIMITSITIVQQEYRAPQLTPSIVRQAKALNITGTYIFIAGFVIWNLGLRMIVNSYCSSRFKATKTSDNMYCDNLTAWRLDIGEYLGGLIQGDRALLTPPIE